MERRHFVTCLLLPLLLSISALAAHAGSSHQVMQAYKATSSDRFSYSIDNSGGMNAEAMGIFKAELDKQLAAARLKSGAASRRAQIHIETY